MEQQILEWKQNDYFNYTMYEQEEVESDELWNWHRFMYHEFAYIYEKCHEQIAMDFHGRILTVYYIEFEDEIILPALGSRFSKLPQVSIKSLQDELNAGTVYKLCGREKEWFKCLMRKEKPQPKPIMDNKYDFRKRIGIDIWKNKRIDKNFGLDIWDKPVIVPLGCEPYL